MRCLEDTKKITKEGKARFTEGTIAVGILFVEVNSWQAKGSDGKVLKENGIIEFI